MKDEKKEILSLQSIYVGGIDVGSEEHYVSVHPSLSSKPVQTFGCYTADLHSMAKWLKSLGITSVAIESTGMYWYGIYLMLESYDISVCLVNAYHAKQVPGRKSDVQDCQWLRELHSYGLLNSSFQPSIQTRELRAYVRQRLRLVSERNRSILHMQKAMDSMNIKLHEAISEITGKSGIMIIEAILSGERNAERLASLANNRIKKSKAELAKALEGFWQESNLFELSQAYDRYKFLHLQITDCDERIELCLAKQKEVLAAGEVKAVKEKNAVPTKKNENMILNLI